MIEWGWDWFNVAMAVGAWGEEVGVEVGGHLLSCWIPRNSEGTSFPQRIRRVLSLHVLRHFCAKHAAQALQAYWIDRNDALELHNQDCRECRVSHTMSDHAQLPAPLPRTLN